MSEQAPGYQAGQPGDPSMPDDAGMISAYINRYWKSEKIIKFALNLLGEEARAWWARKQEHQA